MGRPTKEESIRRRAAAVTAAKTDVPATQPTDPIRPAITSLSGFQNEEELAKAIPDNTNVPVADKPKRAYNRRPKEGTTEIDPLMEDPRYKRAVQNMSALGAPKVVEASFVITGKPLDKSEKDELDDFFYVVSKKFSSVDPMQSNWVLGLFALVMVLRFVAVRLMGTTSFQVFEQFQDFFGKKEETKEEPTRNQTEGIFA